jgi:hypothetical protein
MYNMPAYAEAVKTNADAVAGKSQDMTKTAQTRNR